MAFDTGKLQELFKDKRVLIGAALIGGVAGLYVLSKAGGAGGVGSGGDAGTTPPTTPGAGDTSGGGSTDVAGIQGQIADLVSGQASFQQQVQSWIQGLTDNFNNALGNAQSGNASALQSVIDQFNGQLASGQQNQTLPDFAGFSSQLTQALQSQVQQRVANTGGILKGSTLNIGQKGLIPLTNLPQQLQAPGYPGRVIITGIKAAFPTSNTFQRLGSYVKSQSSAQAKAALPRGIITKIPVGRNAPVSVGSFRNLGSYTKYLPTNYKSIIPRRGGGSTFR